MNRTDEIKVLILIISSNDNPVYSEHKEAWRKYMRTNKFIDCFFMEYHDVENMTIRDDTIYLKGVESFSPGIRKKTVDCLDYFLKGAVKYDYIVRTNLSSFWNFDALLRYLGGLQQSNVYAGVVGNHQGISFVSGSGFIMSPDVAKLLVEKRELFNNSNLLDDVEIGQLLANFNVPLTHGSRQDFYSMSMFKDYTFNNDAYHYRIKWDDHSKRSEEPIVMLELLERVLKQ